MCTCYVDEHDEKELVIDYISRLLNQLYLYTCTAFLKTFLKIRRSIRQMWDISCIMQKNIYTEIFSGTLLNTANILLACNMMGQSFMSLDHWVFFPSGRSCLEDLVLVLRKSTIMHTWCALQVPQTQSSSGTSSIGGSTQAKWYTAAHVSQQSKSPSL